MPRVNFGGKQKDDLKNFVPEGHPIVPALKDYHRYCNYHGYWKYLVVGPTSFYAKMDSAKFGVLYKDRTPGSDPF